MNRYEVAVVGAGPAGMSAAAHAAATGATVVLLDAGTRPGGQYWRHRQYCPPESTNFRKLAAALGAVDYRPDATVWFAAPDGEAGGAGFLVHAGGGPIAARRLVLATGAHDRVVPFPGWDLPGVSTAGGAQALVKGQGVPVGRRVVVAGTGPFLLPVATTLARAGARVVGVFEANNPARMVRHLPVPVGKVWEAARYAGGFARRRIPYRPGWVVVAAHGDEEVRAVTVARGDGRTRRVSCDALAVGYGFVPALELATLLGCRTRVDGDGNLVVAVDDAQQTSVPGVYAAGEITGVGGAELAVTEGSIAGSSAGTNGGVPQGLARRRARLRRFAAALHAVYPVPHGWAERVSEETVVCRCEEVRMRTVREAVTELGATDARTVKMLTRTGMGWCQGRICGYPVACLTARLNGRPVGEADLNAFAHRPIGQPITLGELAGDEADQMGA